MRHPLTSLTLLILGLAAPSSALATTFHVATAANGGSDGNDGSSGSPWLTVSRAADQVPAGAHTIEVGNGDFHESNAIILKEGVDLTAATPPTGLTYDTDTGALTGGTWHTRIIADSVFIRTTPFIQLHSTSGSVGDQTISNLEIDGYVSGSQRAEVGISIQSRDNVRITQCRIKEFQCDNTPLADFGCAAVYPRSIQISDPDSIFWWLPNGDPVMPYNAGPAGDYSDTYWSVWNQYDQPMNNFELDHSIIEDSGSSWDVTSGNGNGAVFVFHLKDASIHHSSLTNFNYRGELISGAGKDESLSENLDIYNNYINTGGGQNQTGVTWDGDGCNNVPGDCLSFCPGSPPPNTGCYVQKDEDADYWSIEIWMWRNNSEIHHNKVEDGGFSITQGKETIVHDNQMWINGSPDWSNSIAYEHINQTHLHVYNNYARNHRQGINIGFQHSNAPYVIDHALVEWNFIENPYMYGTWVECLGPLNQGVTAVGRSEHHTVRNNLYVNTLADRGAGGWWARHANGVGFTGSLDDGAGNCEATDYVFDNNVTFGFVGDDPYRDGYAAGSSRTDADRISNWRGDGNRWYDNERNQQSGGYVVLTNTTIENGTQTRNALYTEWSDAIAGADTTPPTIRNPLPPGTQTCSSP